MSQVCHGQRSSLHSRSPQSAECPGAAVTARAGHEEKTLTPSNTVPNDPVHLTVTLHADTVGGVEVTELRSGTVTVRFGNHRGGVDLLARSPTFTG